MKIRYIFAAAIISSFSIVDPIAGNMAKGEAVHGIAMHGSPKYPAGFTHFPYVNTDAPKGGRMILGALGGFDSVQPFIVRGKRAQGLGLTFQSLLRRGLDEPFALYANIAAQVEMAADRSWVKFVLDPRARSQDGKNITVHDVIFSWKTLRDKGRPNHRYFYSKVAKVETTGEHQIIFRLARPIDRELPLILGLMPIIPAHAFDGRAFRKVTLRPIIGSGPYLISKVDAARSIIYRRNPEFWGRDLPGNKGHFNLDEIRYDYFRDDSTAFEAFKAGNLDVISITDPKRWATGFDFPAARQGKVKKLTFSHQKPSGMFGLIFNTRRSPLKDLEFRKALSHGYDFAWINKNYFHDAYERTVSFFGNSELEAKGAPTSQQSAWLKRFRTELPPEVFGTAALPADIAKLGGLRKALRQAKRILKSAGYHVKDQKLQGKNGQAIELEIMLARQPNKRLAQRLSDFWQRLGIEVNIRLVDSAQFQERLRTYDFDTFFYERDMSLSPGNEQSFYWSRKSAEQMGTRNYPGVRLKSVDEVITRMVQAKARQGLVSAAQLLDRILRAGRYMLPLHHQRGDRLAVWDKFRYPGKPPIYGYHFSRWWQRK